jgi:hypothetical protein
MVSSLVVGRLGANRSGAQIHARRGNVGFEHVGFWCENEKFAGMCTSEDADGGIHPSHPMMSALSSPENVKTSIGHVSLKGQIATCNRNNTPNPACGTA